MNSFFQVERKRHIGNDIVNIIFMDGSPEDAAKFQACSIALPLPELSESVEVEVVVLFNQLKLQLNI